ncbi:uncharacterized protein VTP21DRAFT_9254 [Calcarisporiella thermophila]|uniref:uncharacterized protein n=1 Tax=Calcarisporiella thermophila TaxID=911321 RepID=UPI0037432E31
MNVRDSYSLSTSAHLSLPLTPRDSLMPGVAIPLHPGGKYSSIYGTQNIPPEGGRERGRSTPSSLTSGQHSLDPDAEVFLVHQAHMLRKELEGYRKENEDLRREIEMANRECENYRGELRASFRDSDSQNDKYMLLVKENEALKKKLRRLEEEFTLEKRSLAEIYEKKLEELEGQLGELQSTNQKLRLQLTSLGVEPVTALPPELEGEGGGVADEDRLFIEEQYRKAIQNKTAYSEERAKHLNGITEMMGLLEYELQKLQSAVLVNDLIDAHSSPIYARGDSAAAAIDSSPDGPHPPLLTRSPSVGSSQASSPLMSPQLSAHHVLARVEKPMVKALVLSR